MTLSFIPVFALEAQEGKLFAPLAYTKTCTLAAAAGLAITLIPVLMGYLIRGPIPGEASNRINRALIRAYRPLLDASLRRPAWTIAMAVVAPLLTAIPLSRLGGEFLPPLDEGDLLYMPTALPGLSASKAGELLQQTDRLIKTVPEVASVFGKAGRAESATDPAPMEMFETTMQLQPRDQWRAGMTPAKLLDELDRVVKVPGLSNVRVPPIRNRIDMLSTGIKPPVGVKVSGPDLGQIDQITTHIEALVNTVPGVTSALAERIGGGRYIDVSIDRVRAARHFGGDRSGLHCTGGTGRRVRRRDAGLPAQCAQRAPGSRPPIEQGADPGGDTRRGRAARSSEGHDGGGHSGRLAAHHVWHRGGFRAHAADCRTDGRRHADSALAVAVRDSGRMAIVARETAAPLRRR